MPLQSPKGRWLSGEEGEVEEVDAAERLKYRMWGDTENPVKQTETKRFVC